ncbi:cytochrome P450- family 77- subfamily A-polypeptide 6 [Striga hermonthica]|uniref:Cytochrome P450- family 77- subfamily A-polypeptide 6 n=1 Tax=Striga hermonthica TaxID=68872 RepID=A0A9N7NI53_STRHE|nr:cytochrome P450- family 77- subfamily A-polypeptide 6 [Striga hermonthica]
MDSVLLLLLLLPYYYHLLISLFLVSLAALFLIRKGNKNNNNNSNRKLPPGPPGHPVVGNLFQVAFSGKQFFEYARDLIPIYGPIFTLRMGSRTIIIVASASLAHEALIEKGGVFATRPSENPTRTIFSSNKFTVNAALHGPVWRSLRRNMVYNMLAPGKEIVAALGARKVEEKDVEQLPYLNAFVKELLRKHPPTYFLLTHAVTEPTNLAGYDIPPGTNVEFFSQAISDDPNVWDHPERFDPDRFFQGREEADITGVTGVKMMPFGAGRRICPGLAMGTLHISLMVARMVQEFEWSAYPDGAKIDFSERLIFTVVMKNSLRAKIKPRASV